MKRIKRAKEVLQNNKHYKLFSKFQEQGYVHIFIANMVARLSTTGFPFLLAFFMTSYEVGVIKIFLSYMSLFVLFSGFGIESGIVRFCSAKKTDKQRAELFDILLVLGLGFSVIIMLLVAGLAYFGIFSSDPFANKLLLIGATALPFLVLTSYSSYYLQAQNRFKMLAKLNVSLNIVGLGILLLITVIYYLTGFLIGYIISNVLIAIIMFYFARGQISRQVFVSFWKKVKKIKDVIKFSVYSLLANSVGQINYSLDVIMLSLLGVSVSEIGYYGIAQILVFGLRQFIMSANQISIPSLSKYFSESKQKAKEQYSKHQAFTMLLAIGIVIGGLLVIPLGIKWIMPAYEQSIQIFIILLVGLFFWSQYSVKGITLLAAGRSDINLYISSASLALNVVLNYVLIKAWGVIGAATAIALTYLIIWIIMSIVFSRLKLFEKNSNGVRK